jgi:hypothetical protein
MAAATAYKRSSRDIPSRIPIPSNLPRPPEPARRASQGSGPEHDRGGFRSPSTSRISRPTRTDNGCCRRTASSAGVPAIRTAHGTGPPSRRASAAGSRRQGPRRRLHCDRTAARVDRRDGQGRGQRKLRELVSGIHACSAGGSFRAINRSRSMAPGIRSGPAYRTQRAPTRGSLACGFTSLLAELAALSMGQRGTSEPSNRRRSERMAARKGLRACRMTLERSSRDLYGRGNRSGRGPSR